MARLPITISLFHLAFFIPLAATPALAADYYAGKTLEFLETRSGLDPELLAERPPRAPVRFQRLCLTAAVVESEHQLSTHALAEGVGGDQGLELGDERVLAPEGEIRVDPCFERGQAKLLETGDLGLCERLEREVCEGPRPAPERKGIPKRRRGLLRLAARELAPAAFQLRLEAMDVELVRRNLDHIASGVREQELLAVTPHEEAPQPREVDAQGRVDRRRGGVSPQLFDEALARDGLVDVHEQQAEERALLRAPERQCLLTSDDLERPEDVELEIGMARRGSIVRPSSSEYEWARAVCSMYEWRLAAVIAAV